MSIRDAVHMLSKADQDGYVQVTIDTYLVPYTNVPDDYTLEDDEDVAPHYLVMNNEDIMPIEHPGDLETVLISSMHPLDAILNGCSDRFHEELSNPHFINSDDFEPNALFQAAAEVGDMKAIQRLLPHSTPECDENIAHRLAVQNGHIDCADFIREATAQRSKSQLLEGIAEHHPDQPQPRKARRM